MGHGALVIGIRPHAIPTVRNACRVNGNWALRIRNIILKKYVDS